MTTGPMPTNRIEEMLAERLLPRLCDKIDREMGGRMTTKPKRDNTESLLRCALDTYEYWSNV